MSKKEASARIKINKLLDESGWRLIDERDRRANVDVETRLNPGEKLDTHSAGEDFENTKGGFIDYLLLDENQKPIAVLEAKRESIPPLSAKEQARNYANGMHVRYVILSNGNVHYLWDMLEGNPEPIVKLPTLSSLQDSANFKANPQALATEKVDETYVAKSQMPDFEQQPSYKAGGNQQEEFIRTNKLKILRSYQVDAVHAIQTAAAKGNKRYLLEMATGTGKTLTCAAIIKLFLKTENARRVLFLVDRIELENQAQTAFQNALGSDFTVLTYKKNKEDWGKAEVVVSTVQSLQTNDRYKDDFSPTDFDLVISDEAHRSIGGNARAVFEYFVGYRVGLTATPKDYLKGVDKNEEGTQKDFEHRLLLDTYATFGCETGQPTYRYSLTDGVNDPNGPYLVNPVIIDARTEITTQLLSDEGYAVHKVNDEGTEIDAVFGARQFEHTFFNDETNEVLAATFLDNADTDPMSGEVGKSIIFVVSQAHAARVVNTLNQQAMERWPGKYQSDFAIQITSNVTDAQHFTTRFSENDLLGQTRWLENYASSRARVAVTVGMMTTGYDCSDLQNVVFMRPVFSPSDFIQMKGRGTRLHKFVYVDYEHDEEVIEARKESFKLIDFFAVCDYFDEKYDYQAALSVPKKVSAAMTSYAPPSAGTSAVEEPSGKYGPIDIHESDSLQSTRRTIVGGEGMVVDREMFKKFVQDAREDTELIFRDENDREAALEYLKNKVLDKPSHYMTLDKIRKYFKLDRKLGLGEALDIIMGRVDEPKRKAELVDDRFNDFMVLKDFTEKLSNDNELYHLSHQLFDAYISSEVVKKAIDSGEYGDLEQTNQVSLAEFSRLHEEGIAEPLIAYIRDYIDIDKLRG
jgi:type I restriction enzyme R subunit